MELPHVALPQSLPNYRHLLPSQVVVAYAQCKFGAGGRRLHKTSHRPVKTDSAGVLVADDGFPPPAEAEEYGEDEEVEETGQKRAQSASGGFLAHSDHLDLADQLRGLKGSPLLAAGLVGDLVAELAELGLDGGHFHSVCELVLGHWHVVDGRGR